MLWVVLANRRVFTNSSGLGPTPGNAGGLVEFEYLVFVQQHDCHTIRSCIMHIGRDKLWDVSVLGVRSIYYS